MWYISFIIYIIFIFCRTIPFVLTYYFMKLSGEVYQYAVIPRGIAACNRNFTFYQKKRLEPNPGKPRQITSYQKNFFTYFDFFLNFPMATSIFPATYTSYCSYKYLAYSDLYSNLFSTSPIVINAMIWAHLTSPNNCRAAIKSLGQ